MIKTYMIKKKIFIDTSQRYVDSIDILEKYVEISLCFKHIQNIRLVMLNRLHKAEKSNAPKKKQVVKDNQQTIKKRSDNRSRF